MTRLRIIIAWLLNGRSLTRYRQHRCPSCTGILVNLPSAPGWYDSKRCCSCNIDWDDVYRRVRGRAA